MMAGTKQDVKTIDREIHRLVEERAHEYVTFLTGLLRFPTVSGDEAEKPARDADPVFQAAWRYLRHEAERLGLAFRDHEGCSAVIEWQGTDPDAPTLGIATHLDVVPVDEGSWTHPPFSGAVVGGDIWGRGTQDDKGPIAMVLAAFDVLRRLGLQPRRTIRLLIGSYEETEDWPDMDRLLEVEEVPDEVIVPDGGFPIGIGEKGIATLEWATDWPRSGSEDEILVFRGLEGGERANVVPANALLTFDAHAFDAERAKKLLDAAALRLTRVLPDARPMVTQYPVVVRDEAERVPFTVAFQGRAAHAAIPHEGHNAALDALAFLTLFPESGGPGYRFARFLYAATRPVDGSAIGIDRVHPMMGHTTLNLGRIEMDAAGAHTWMNVRFPVGTTPRDIEAAFVRHAKTAPQQLHLHTRMIGRPQPAFLVDTTRHEAFLEPLGLAYETVTGHEATRLAIAGTTYAKLFPLAVGFGPVDLVRAEPVRVHQVDERVSIERYLENIRIYALAIDLLAFPPLDASHR